VDIQDIGHIIANGMHQPNSLQSPPLNKMRRDRLLVLATTIVFFLLILIGTFNVHTVRKRPWEWQYQNTSLSPIGECESKTIPKKIWAFWNSDILPDTVQRCIDTWYEHCPDYEITVLRPGTLQDFIDEDLLSLPFANTPQRLSDFVRLHVIHKYGGFWIDASSILFDNLDYYHQKQQLCPQVTELVGYYLDAFTSRPEFPVIENWFFGCVKDSRLMAAWKAEFMRINQFSSVVTYVENIRMNGIDLQRIGPFVRYYLSMHVAAQSVFQRNKGLVELVSLDRAEDGPLEYLVRHHWNSRISVDNVCQNKFRLSCPFIKLRGCEHRLIHETDVSRIILNRHG
jgi:hypothetical protein